MLNFICSFSKVTNFILFSKKNYANHRAFFGAFALIFLCTLSYKVSPYLGCQKKKDQ
jgi:hypothetical protein